MEKTERIYALHRELVSARRPVSMKQLGDSLECSEATIKRLLTFMRDRLGAPITWQRDGRGYCYSDTYYELPGMWFSESELYALLAAEQLLEQAQDGVLSARIRPLKQRIAAILQLSEADMQQLRQRIVLMGTARRTPPSQCFQTCASATLKRRQLRFRYRARSTEDEMARQVSPHRMLHYRDNWYLEGWDHRRRDWRRFAIECISEVREDNASAISPGDGPEDGYGIFEGAPTQMAVLRFTVERARWVADEIWHPAQTGQRLEDGRYELTLPYADATELVMDILRHGEHVEVLAPTALRENVIQALRRAAARY